MSAPPKESENAIGSEEIHVERQESPKGGQEAFTVEETVEIILFGKFHILLFLIMGSTGERRGRFKDLIHPKYLRTTLQIRIIWFGTAFAYYGVILASAELLERDLVCGSAAPLVPNPGNDSEGSCSFCHCRLFGPLAYQTMIISMVGEIAVNPLNILGINVLGRRLSLCITMGCAALFFLLLNICTSRFALGMGVSGSLCRVGAMVAPFISQVLMSASFIGALCLFSSVCIVSAISVFTLPIETKGKALQVCIAI